jgi:hypothetical protein
LFVCEWRAETTEIKHRQFEVKRKEKPIEETTREKEPQQTPLLTSYASPGGKERIPIEIVHMWELNPRQVETSPAYASFLIEYSLTSILLEIASVFD